MFFGAMVSVRSFNLFETITSLRAFLDIWLICGRTLKRLLPFSLKNRNSFCNYDISTVFLNWNFFEYMWFFKKGKTIMVSPHPIDLCIYPKLQFNFWEALFFRLFLFWLYFLSIEDFGWMDCFWCSIKIN